MTGAALAAAGLAAPAAATVPAAQDRRFGTTMTPLFAPVEIGADLSALPAVRAGRPRADHRRLPAPRGRTDGGRGARPPSRPRLAACSATAPIARWPATT